uniref:Uncharacterized protein n=1 Tax=Arundo donax TaxID=35708 RepID=A0A0A9C0D3_ARUDO
MYMPMISPGTMVVSSPLNLAAVEFFSLLCCMLCFNDVLQTVLAFLLSLQFLC